MEDLLEKIQDYKRPLLIFAGLILLLAFYFRGNRADENLTEEVFSYEETDQQPNQESEGLGEDIVEEEMTQIVVDIKGAVLYPSVYYLDPGQRMVDLIQLAGGFTDDADDRQVNLAQVLADQQMIYIPRKGESLLVESAPGQPSQEGQVERININTADEKELTQLNGIGEKKAQQIIAHREAQGSFKRIEDLMEVSGIGEKTFESLKDFITVGP